jgi:hypothetical protein
MTFPNGTSGADLFVEAPDGIYLPLPRRTTEAAGVITYEIDLKSGLEPKDLIGKALQLTAVSDGAQSASVWLVR